MLNPNEYEHKYDRNALNVLNKIPGLDKHCRDEMKNNWERQYRLIHTGSSIKVTPTQFPTIFQILLEACANINLKTIPDLYIQKGFDINAFTIGSEKPSIMVHGEAIELLTPEEILCLIGHEAGHIKSGHVLYKNMARKITGWSSLIAEITFGLGGFLQDSLESTFKYWDRMSEFTADRAGLLACQDINTAISLDMKLSGVPPKLYDEMDLNEFIKQAQEFKNYDSDRLDKHYKDLLTVDQTHPWTVIRSFELLKWVESGKYQKIIDKHSNIKFDEIKCPKCGCTLEGHETFCGVCREKLWTR